MDSTLIEGEDYYYLNGFMVFTEQFHLKRGTCCKNNCKHCPFGFNKSNDQEDKCD